ncbi:alpha/beta hydrolase [Gordonia sp. VNQ95]|uniref:alpha/beta hydrolase n=1 Tax=Gordonia sp. VNQ95 TaxID=3156619 RepID=UPI0032B4689D
MKTLGGLLFCHRTAVTGLRPSARIARRRVRAHILWLLGFACTVGLACTVAAGPATAAPNVGTAPAPASVTRVTTTIDTTCAGAPKQVPVTWYLPAGQPTGLVWLQHGFSRTAANLDVEARNYAASGLLVAAPTLDSVSVNGCGIAFNASDNTAFIRQMALEFGHAVEPDSAVGRSFARASAQAHRPDLTMPAQLVFSGHSAGGEFVLTAANQLRTADPEAYRRLAGLVLFDPVNSFLGNNFYTSAKELGAAELPIRVIASQPSVSNTGGLGVTWLSQTTRQDFLGVRLVTGVHIDVESDSTDLIGELSELAVPRPRNGRVIRRLSAQWADDLITGTRTPAYYPGGSYYQSLVASHTITTLPVG